MSDFMLILYCTNPSKEAICYDLSNNFLTYKAGNFYYELTNTTADNKYFNLDSSCMHLTTQKSNEILDTLNSTSAEDVKSMLKLPWISQRIDDAVNATNKLIIDKVTSDRTYYK